MRKESELQKDLFALQLLVHQIHELITLSNKLLNRVSESSVDKTSKKVVPKRVYKTDIKVSSKDLMRINQLLAKKYHGRQRTIRSAMYMVERRLGIKVPFACFSSYAIRNGIYMKNNTGTPSIDFFKKVPPMIDKDFIHSK